VPTDAKPTGLRELLALPNEDPRKLLTVAIALCLVCSLAVSSAAVLLRPLQEKNAALALKREILQVSELLDSAGASDQDVETLFAEQVDTRILDLASGELTDMDPAAFDPREAARDPATSVTVPPSQDIARIRSRAKYASVYLVRQQGQIQSIVLPVYGSGLWSTMYGLLALDRDGRTIKGMTFYEQGETAGLGAEIENPRWLAQWRGKLVADEQGEVRFELVKGGVDEDSPDARYQVDGLAGATLTADGVTNMMRYWLSDNGFGPYLDKVRAGGGEV
jgi:Na+-transporting NADH:ubiquinone oxidoreductase subunit C